jgi:hypothetical protein
MNSLVQRLAPLTLQDLDRGDVTLGSLWQDKPVLLTFVRHFG